jgi:hypothetical protein
LNSKLDLKGKRAPRRPPAIPRAAAASAASKEFGGGWLRSTSFAFTRTTRKPRCGEKRASITQEAQPYFSSREEQNYQKARLLAADALLLGRKTYEKFSKAYPEMAKAGEGAPADFVDRMNAIPKYVASTTLKETSWNATPIRGDIADEIRKIKNQPGKDIISTGRALSTECCSPIGLSISFASFSIRRGRC